MACPTTLSQGELLWYHSWLRTTDVPVMDMVEKYQVYPLWTAWVKAYTKPKYTLTHTWAKKKKKKNLKVTHCSVLLFPPCVRQRTGGLDLLLYWISTDNVHALTHVYTKHEKCNKEHHGSQDLTLPWYLILSCCCWKKAELVVPPPRRAGAPPPVSERLLNCNFSSTFAHGRQI